MSAHVPDAGAAEAAAAVAELRILVHRLADEVAAFRRRALQAESRVRELEQALEQHGAAERAGEAEGAGEPPPDPRRVQQLMTENEQLRRRLEQAAERTRQLLERARFLRQQQGEVPS